ncbi:MAG: tetratricopeptide repeat protein, partial [Candidatus Omnitrophica bacterium]|nr:tetratricopeptide repeat protein [Candidatus Omnitrophota bacterium]
MRNEEGNRYYKKGQVGKAQSAYSKALKADPASRPIAFNLGNTYYKEEDYGRSAELYQKAAAEEKDVSLKTRALYNLGNSLAQRRQTGKAV